MTQAQAQAIAKDFLSNEENITIYVTSDYAVYVNSEIEVIKNHAKANKLEFFTVREIVKKSIEIEPEIEIVEEKPKAKKAKK